MKKEKKVKREETDKSVSKIRAKILIISVIAAIVLLVALNSIDYGALADKITGDNVGEKQEVETYPEHYFEEPIFDEDITSDEEYMDLDRYVYLKIGNEINQLSGSSYEEGTMERFWIDYFDAVTGADSQTLNALHTSHFTDQNGKYGKFAPQKLYEIKVEMISSAKVEEGECAGCYQYFAKVNYNIYENNGTFRKDLRSDESREQIFELIEGKFGIRIHTVSYPKENIPTEQKGGISFMTFVWIALIIFSVIVEMMTVSLVSIWFMPAGLIALVLSLFNVHVAVQIVVYLLSAALLLILSRTLLKDKIVPKREATNADRVIGMKAIVTEDIDPIAETGEVKVDGKRWSARMTDGGCAKVNDVVAVVRIEGVKLYCERSQSDN